jgi:hypothetical protein
MVTKKVVADHGGGCGDLTASGSEGSSMRISGDAGSVLDAMRPEMEHDYKQISRKARESVVGGSNNDSSKRAPPLMMSTWDRAFLDVEEAPPLTAVGRDLAPTAAPRASQPTDPPPPPPTSVEPVKVSIDWANKSVQQQLQKAVRAHTFDFKAVAAEFCAESESNSATVIATAEECRVEFAKLARMKATVATGETAVASKPPTTAEGVAAKSTASHTLAPQVKLQAKLTHSSPLNIVEERNAPPSPKPAELALAPEVAQYTDMSELD